MTFWPAQAMLGSATYVLTDFDQENGSTAYVPGSHKLCRPPRGAEINMADPCNPDARAVKAPAGSLIVWHGHT